jgi:hypothetical protein
MPAARLLVVARAGGDAGEAGRAAAVTRSLPGTGSVLRFGLRGAGPQPGPQLHEVRTGQARQRPGVAGQPAEELAPEADPSSVMASALTRRSRLLGWRRTIPRSSSRSTMPVRLEGSARIRSASSRIGSASPGCKATANCADPGFARTSLAREAHGPFAAFIRLAAPFQDSPQKACGTAVYLAADPGTTASGQFFANRKAVPLTGLALDDEAAQRLWDISVRLCDISDHGQGHAP